MWLLVNHQLILIAIQAKSILSEQICYKRSQGIVVTSLHCLLFLTSKKKDRKWISKSATNVVQHWNFSEPQSLFFHSNILKWTIWLHSVRPIRPLDFLRRDDYSWNLVKIYHFHFVKFPEWNEGDFKISKKCTR